MSSALYTYLIFALISFPGAEEVLQIFKNDSPLPTKNDSPLQTRGGGGGVQQSVLNNPGCVV